MKKTFQMGMKEGLFTTWQLGKIIFPISVLVALLQHTPVMGWITAIFSPIMNLFGLPGDAAIVLALGNLVSIYAAIGAILTLTLTVKQVFILAVMLSFSHSLFVESAIAAKIGVKAWHMVVVRLSLGFVVAWIIDLLWRGGQEIAEYGMIPVQQQLEGWFSITTHAIESSLIGIFQIAIIVIPIMIGIQFLKDLQVLPILAKKMTPFTRILGVSEKTGVPLMAGLIFGIAFGAGVIIQAAKEERLTKKDLYLVSIFLVACHAVIEDTLIFIPLGIPVLPLLLIRLFTAILVTAGIAWFWSRIDADRSTNKKPIQRQA
ncbi:nucleoside recognition domain-containing protein [Ammoniphilus resinae]|uniref:Nucleoside transporter/FeoB GTPase Gate domain-containing protein n=1 Tax=Ammoniphilus resinae TaxID=861532 RepID=A0ABS4GLX6_9BACL|nr:nucleoside recognition domain-containing protein [Ammoniphilus resinae]MBP1931277.1 hypothetical protein [Ammoniphilus resinae]